MTEVKKGTCHCGAVEFEVTLEEEIQKGARCNCSLCRRKGAVMVLVPWENIKIVQGKDKLTLYQWNLKIAKHYFCSICGIYTHHQRRSDPTGCGFNVACIEGVDPYAIEEIAMVNGASLSVVEEELT